VKLLQHRQDDDLSSQDGEQPKGISSLIEQVHNVSTRTERPSKRRRIEHTNDAIDATKPAFSGGGKGGEIGEYMRQKRKQGQEENKTGSSFVDLTVGKFSQFLH
jgi:hypothetical protein